MRVQFGLVLNGVRDRETCLKCIICILCFNLSQKLSYDLKWEIKIDYIQNTRTHETTSIFQYKEKLLQLRNGLFMLSKPLHDFQYLNKHANDINAMNFFFQKLNEKKNN